MKLEKAINPLLDDDLLVAISYLFERILSEHLMNVENFQTNKKQFLYRFKFQPYTRYLECYEVKSIIFLKNYVKNSLK